jgi:hypothetical protein
MSPNHIFGIFLFSFLAIAGIAPLIAGIIKLSCGWDMMVYLFGSSCSVWNDPPQTTNSHQWAREHLVASALFAVIWEGFIGAAIVQAIEPTWGRTAFFVYFIGLPFLMAITSPFMKKFGIDPVNVLG